VLTRIYPNRIRGHRSDGEIDFAAKERTRQLVIGRFHDMQLNSRQFQNAHCEAWSANDRERW
jgi:hypothetical protein